MAEPDAEQCGGGVAGKQAPEGVRVGLASSICTVVSLKVVSLKVVSTRLRHSAMT